MSDDRAMHPMLIAYVSGTLAADARASFREHLEDCASCAGDLPSLEALRAEVEALGEPAFSGHPDPAALVAAVLDDDGIEIEPSRRDAARQHLQVCSLCAEEAGWIAGEAPAELPHAASPSSSGDRSAFESARRRRPDTLSRSPWVWGGAVAATLLVGLVAVPFLLRPTGSVDTGISPLALVEATQRAGDGTSVVVPPGANAVHLLFRVDLGPRDLPARFEVVDARERLVHREKAVRTGDLHRGRFLLFACLRSDCPDGAYVGRLTPAGDDTLPVEYPFRVVEAED